MFKRLFDIIFSFIGIVILHPLFILVAISIKLDSSGPIFFRGKRVGCHGKLFKMYKFRTMVVNAEKLGGTSTAENDPRITKVGRFIRKYKIDELPQLINILKGEMSIVGPRPEVEEYTCLYTEEEKIILSVLPGLTDYASIKLINLNKILTRSTDPDKDYKENIRPEKNRLRVEYATNHSLSGDFRIIIQTFMSLWRR